MTRNKKTALEGLTSNAVFLSVNKATVCRHLKKAKRALRRAAGYAGLPV